jgi:hypothetical protein
MTSKTIGRAAAVVAVGVAGLWLIGCKNSSSQTTVVEERRGVVVQEQSVTLAPGEERIIRYPTRYAVPPNLTVKSVDDKCQVLEKREDYFRIVNTQKDRPGYFTWKASSSNGTTNVVEGQPRSVVLQTGGPPAPPRPFLTGQ